MAPAEILMEFPHYPAARSRQVVLSRLAGFFRPSGRKRRPSALPHFDAHMMRDIGLASDVRRHHDPRLTFNRHMGGFIG